MWAITAVLVALAGIVIGVLLGSGVWKPSGSSDQAASDTSMPGTGSTALQQAGPTAPEKQTYTDPEYGYTFEYPESWLVLGGANAQGQVGSTAISRISVFDPAGGTVGTTYIDLVNVAVYRLNASVDESMMGAIRPEVETVVADLQGKGTAVQSLEALALQDDHQLR
jgi:hypothetical protein